MPMQMPILMLLIKYDIDTNMHIKHTYEGQDEDREAACLIQQTVTAQANSHLTFGYFEKAIVNFHQHLTETLDL